MDFFTIFLGVILTLLLGFISVCFLIWSITEPYPSITQYERESFYIDGTLGRKKKFPSYADKHSCNLSIIIPAYNEELRLPPMLDESFDYLETRSKNSSFTYEIILVDDGSCDSTTKVGFEYVDKYGSDKMRVLKLQHNRGKGGAVRLGMMRSRGEMLLFADADGATTFEDFNKLEKCLKLMCKDSKNLSESFAIVCGSRAHLAEESIAERSFFRSILMYGFHFMVWLLAVKSIKDTQCGFKLFTRRAARVIFNSLHVERWAFDVEMLCMAESLSIPIDEVPVRWIEIDGSKVTPVLSWIEMGMDLVLIWFKYTIGAWRIKGDVC